MDVTVIGAAQIDRRSKHLHLGRVNLAAQASREAVPAGGPTPEPGSTEGLRIEEFLPEGDQKGKGVP